MLSIGITGAMAAGKSTTAKMFHELGGALFDADAVVHRLYNDGQVIQRVERLFPGVGSNTGVNRKALGDMIARTPQKLDILEDLIHPLVKKARVDFSRDMEGKGFRFCIFDIPLLLETRGWREVDVVVVADVDGRIQKKRLGERGHQSRALQKYLLSRHYSLEEKRRRAHFVVDTSEGLSYARRQVGGVVKALVCRLNS